jgi:pSer/pThr/pTyr-binding forkhead associated (FHA) protein
VRLRRGVNRIGQAADNEIVIPQDTVSRRHAEIEVTGQGVMLRDLATNGTFVNEVPVEGAHRLASGDRVRIADIDLEFVR